MKQKIMIYYIPMFLGVGEKVKQHWRESMFLMVDVGTIVHGKASFIMSMVGEYP